MIIKKNFSLVLTLTSAVGISYLTYYSFLETEFSGKIREIRKAGYPASPEELEKWYPGTALASLTTNKFDSNSVFIICSYTRSGSIYFPQIWGLSLWNRSLDISAFEAHS